MVTGSERVVPAGPMGGVLRFDIPRVGVAGVGTSQPKGDALELDTGNWIFTMLQRVPVQR